MSGNSGRSGRRVKKRVLFVQQYFYPDISAVSQLLGELLERLSDSDKYEFTVLCSAHARPRPPILPRRLGRVSIKRVPTFFGYNKNIVSLALHTAAFHIAVFLFLILSDRSDIVVSMTSPPFIGFTVALALLGRRRKFIYYVEDLYPELLFDSRVVKKTFVVKKLSLFNRVTLRRADRTIVIGEYMARKLYLNYGIPRGELHVVPNWAPGVHPEPPRKSSSFSIMYSGNLGFAHDLSLLRSLIVELRQYDVFYKFVGAGRKFRSVQDMFRNEGERRVMFHGYVDLSEHGSVLAGANVFLVAQSWRTVGDLLPSKFYSYLAAGRPIVFLGPTRSEIGNYILKHDIGAVVEVQDDIEPAVAKLLRYMEDPTYYEETCHRISREYADNFGVALTSSAVEDILDDLRPQQ